ncbi:MAG: DUF3604 domain-containing protein [Woeseiaceae bacterium]
MPIAAKARFSALLLLALGVIASTSIAHADETVFPSQVYWGDTHLHSNLSGDAFSMGLRLDPDTAYRFAKGEAVTSTGGREVQLSRPLDFLLIADHAENLGVLPRLVSDDTFLADNELANEWRETLMGLPPVAEIFSAESFEEYSAGLMPLYLAKQAHGQDYPLSEEFKNSVWQGVGELAERHYEPGTFTTFIGYEWSGNKPRMIHRNVLFADGPELTSRVLPFSAYDSNDVEDLWTFFENFEKETGGKVMSIPHNSNLSKGGVFSVVTISDKPFDKAYAERRARWEPISEVTQIKGDSETHPALSPGDAYADFETWPPALWGGTAIGEPGSYARSALKNGLDQEARLGINPFKFGMIGSTDSHTGLATADENLFYGKMSMGEPSPYRAIDQWFYSASGYAGVWAEENTREALFAAMQRREVYATTGPRMIVRFFGGWDFSKDDLAANDIATVGYARGVPMGGDLVPTSDGKAPRFVVFAMKDPDGANLDRVQIIKGWRDSDGELHEQVYDVAMASEQETVQLATVWEDPNFDASNSAFYYVRVLEVVTPRWTAYDAEEFSMDGIPDEALMTVQERAYTSPIWYTP